MGSDVADVARVCVKETNTRFIPIPVGKTGFLPSSAGAPLMDLRADGKHIPSAATRKIHQRLCIERHVVVHEQGPVEPRPPKPQIDGGAKP